MSQAHHVPPFRCVMRIGWNHTTYWRHFHPVLVTPILGSIGQPWVVSPLRIAAMSYQRSFGHTWLWFLIYNHLKWFQELWHMTVYVYLKMEYTFQKWDSYRDTGDQPWNVGGFAYNITPPVMFVGLWTSSIRSVSIINWVNPILIYIYIYNIIYIYIYFYVPIVFL